MMKNALLTVLLLVLVILPCAADAGSREFKVTPLKIDGTVMTAVAEVADLAGGTLKWDAVAQSAELSVGDTIIKLAIGDKVAQTNSGEKVLPQAPMLENGRMLAPVRLLVDELGGTIQYASTSKVLSVHIGNNSIEGKVRDFVRPTIKISRIPPSGSGENSWGTIAGEVRGVSNPEQYKVVVYAITDMWYVQPWGNAPHTKIGSDGKWTTGTHLGWEYAVLLVRSGYNPEVVRSDEPQVMGEVLAITQVKAR